MGELRRFGAVRIGPKASWALLGVAGSWALVAGVFALRTEPPTPANVALTPPPVPDVVASVDAPEPMAIEKTTSEPEELPAPPPRLSVEKAVPLRRGDALVTAIRRAGVDAQEAFAAANAFAQIFDARRLRAGDELLLEITEATPVELLTLRYAPTPDRRVIVERVTDAAFAARMESLDVTETQARRRGVIASSLYEAAQDAGMPRQVMVDLIRLYSFDVDFQRDLRNGDTFDVLYDQAVLPSGDVARFGPIRYANLSVRGSKNPYYRFTPPDDGATDYFSPEGRSARKLLMRTPVDGARLSSGYGSRKHPILGYRTQHRGVDFAAPTGTPIMAAGDGVIARASRWGAYGRYVQITHVNGYATAYAHLSRYADGIDPGDRVRQGQIIGYVGASGRATGPHLHYEVLKNGTRINPMTLNAPTGRALDGDVKTAFEAHRARIDRALAAGEPGAALKDADRPT